MNEDGELVGMAIAGDRQATADLIDRHAAGVYAVCLGLVADLDRAQDLSRIRIASTFYGALVKDGRAVMYFGDQVRPGDAGRVLMRWRVGDNDYRVVYGDLQIETVSGPVLLELEASGR